MKTCTYCGRENDDQTTKCQECGAEFGRVPPPTADASRESSGTMRFEKITVLDNEVQAELMDEVLSGRKIPHIMQSYYDSALDGIFQTGKGWGVILAPAPFREEILAALADIRRQSQSPTGGSQGNNP
jgi:hypothetical protein